MRVLILGGTGAIGSHLCEILAGMGHAVFVTSRSPRACQPNITYVQGNAHHDGYLASLLESRWDCIVDFLNYRTTAFAERFKALLSSTDHYVFLSSARVFAGSDAPLTENSPRLLDVTNDRCFLDMDEYGVAKARQEDMLFGHQPSNWTIVRPYITYDAYRLQLGVLEKEEWLARALRGAPIIFPTEMLDRRTTMTRGQDVALSLAKLIASPASTGEAFNVTTSQWHTWQDILDRYVRLIQDGTGRKPAVHVCDLVAFERAFPRRYQIHYDRLFHRVFDNRKLSQIIDVSSFCSVSDGLRQAMNTFLDRPHFRYIDWGLEGKADRVAGSWTWPHRAPNPRAAVKYLRYRCLPFATPASPQR